jgi:AhpD family alkylhydroperoxidase
MKLANVSPDGYSIVKQLDRYCKNSIDPTLKDLISLRASLINGCAFCVDTHSVDLQNSGMPIRKIFSVTTWEDSPFFSDVERMALELTESITNISTGVTDDLWKRAMKVFDEQELGDIVLAIGTINILNRISISTKLQASPLDC